MEYQNISRDQAPDATTVLVLGILSIALGGCSPFGVILGLIGFILSARAYEMNRDNPGVFVNYGSVQAGRICSIVGMVLGAIGTAFFVAYFSGIILVIIAAAKAQGA